MGVTCDSHTINIAVVEEGQVLEDLPERITTPVGLEEHARLWALLGDVERAIDVIKPEKVVVLPPEQTYQAAHSQFSPRIARETIVRMGAHRKGIGIEVLARATVKARLDLPRKGGLETHLDTAFPEAVGKYWRSGRGLAAMAAAAGERS